LRPLPVTAHIKVSSPSPSLPHIEVLSSFYDIRFLNERRNPCSCKTQRARRGWETRAGKICDLLTCSQSTTNITCLLLLFTARDNNSSLFFSVFSRCSSSCVLYFLSSFLLFVRLCSGWIILLAWQNYLSLLSLKPNFFFFSVPSFVDYQTRGDPLFLNPSPNLCFVPFLLFFFFFVFVVSTLIVLHVQLLLSVLSLLDQPV